MKITESQLRNIIKQELKNALSEAPMDPERRARMLASRARNRQAEKEFAAKASEYYAAREAVPPEERTYFKRGKIESTPQEYESDLYGGGGNVWKGEDGKYYKMAVVPATAQEYESALWSGDAGRNVWREK